MSHTGTCRTVSPGLRPKRSSKGSLLPARVYVEEMQPSLQKEILPTNGCTREEIKGGVLHW